VTPRSTGVRARCHSPWRMVAVMEVAARAAATPIRGRRATASRARPARAASAATAALAPSPAATAPARAGPAMAAVLKLVASRALARGSSRSGTSEGIMLVNPPVASGAVSPATAASSSRTQPGARPAVTRITSRLPPSTTWLLASAAWRRAVRSSQAPSTGPVTTLGRVEAATAAPARPGRPVRSSTSSTTATANISLASRASVAASRYAGQPGWARSPPGLAWTSVVAVDTATV